MSVQRLAVIGAGAFGSWIALLASRAGIETTLIDQYGPANNYSSSGGSSRIIRRAYGRDAIYARLAARSLETWITFFKEENRLDCLDRTGVLWMTRRDSQSIRAARRTFEKNKIPYRFLNKGLAIEAFCPQFRISPDTVAIFEPDGGALLATQSIEAVVRAATNSGVRKIIGRADPVNATNFLPAIKLASGDEVEADLFVFACGSWLGKVFPELLGARIFPTRQEVFFFNAPQNWLASGAPRLPIWVDETDRRIPYGFPDINGAGIKISFHTVGPAFDPDYDSRQIGREESFKAADYLRSRFPDMRTPEYRHAEICHYENTSRGDLLIDRHPSLRNVWFAGGGSGHGFKHAPAIARYLLNAISRGKSSQRRFQLATKGTKLRKTVV